MNHSRRHSTSNERGQTTTEFAIILPIFCLLLFGVIQFGILFNNYVTLTDAVRAGARKAAVSRQTSDPAGVCRAQIKASAGDLDQSKLQPDCQSDWTPASDVVVTAKYPYDINLLWFNVASGFLKSTTTERVE
jgi:Flp pilus assembly protein TadG